MTPITPTKFGAKFAVRIAGIAAMIFAAQAAVAQQPEALSVDVSKCVELATPEERLACFEAQVEEAQKAPPAPAAAAAAPVAASGTQSGSRDGREETPADIHATVTELRETVPNAFLITLSNGQVWRQTQPEHYPLRPGSVVRIYYSKWRSYRLTNEDLRGYIQVERVR